MKRAKLVLVIALLAFIFAVTLPMAAIAAVTFFWLDSSGSMHQDGRFESAKDVLIQEIVDAKPGDVLYIGHFDSNDYLLGRLAVNEAGSQEEKRRLIEKVKRLSATGRWTNLDQPLKASKALMLDERATGRIVLFSDGLSDPSPDHQPVDLQRIAAIVPQRLGWAVYLIGLSQDIEGLLQTRLPEDGLTVNEHYPHVKGIALTGFTHEKIQGALDTVKRDVEKSTEKTASTPQSKRPAVPAPWLAVGTALLLGAVGVPLQLVQRSKMRRKLPLVFEVRGTDGEGEDLEVVLEDGKRKTVGPKGEIAIEAQNLKLPPIVLSILWKDETLWLFPVDSVAVNGKPANAKVAIGINDVIRVRDRIVISIREGETNVAA